MDKDIDIFDFVYAEDMWRFCVEYHFEEYGKCMLDESISIAEFVNKNYKDKFKQYLVDNNLIKNSTSSAFVLFS